MQDNEVIDLYNQLKEMQAEFQVAHSTVEQLRSESTTPLEIKKEIQQLETEREQLTVKISKFKSRNSNSGPFQHLLQMTSNLRKEQEEEARIGDKLSEGKQQIEWNEQQLMLLQQRAIDLEKTQNDDTTAIEMLNILSTDVRKNREIIYER